MPPMKAWRCIGHLGKCEGKEGSQAGSDRAASFEGGQVERLVSLWGAGQFEIYVVVANTCGYGRCGSR